MSAHNFKHLQRNMMLTQADKCLHLCKSCLWLALAGGRTRFLALAKSYGGQFRSISEHCLLYSNGSTDGDVNKSIEICLQTKIWSGGLTIQTYLRIHISTKSLDSN